MNYIAILKSDTSTVNEAWQSCQSSYLCYYSQSLLSFDLESLIYNLYQTILKFKLSS
jgi:hypothetical protein